MNHSNISICTTVSFLLLENPKNEELCEVTFVSKEMTGNMSWSTDKD